MHQLDDAFHPKGADDHAIPHVGAGSSDYGGRRVRFRRDAKLFTNGVDRGASVRAGGAGLSGWNQPSGTALRIARERLGLGFEAFDHRVDLAPRIAESLLDPFVEPSLERLFAVSEFLLARVQ